MKEDKRKHAHDETKRKLLVFSEEKIQRDECGVNQKSISLTQPTRTARHPVHGNPYSVTKKLSELNRKREKHELRGTTTTQLVPCNERLKNSLKLQFLRFIAQLHQTHFITFFSIVAQGKRCTFIRQMRDALKLYHGGRFGSC